MKRLSIEAGNLTTLKKHTVAIEFQLQFTVLTVSPKTGQNNLFDFFLK